VGNDIDGSALAAQPGKSQGRPPKSPGSNSPIVQNGLPNLRSPKKAPRPGQSNLGPPADTTGALKEQFHAPTTERLAHRPPDACSRRRAGALVEPSPPRNPLGRSRDPRRRSGPALARHFCRKAPAVNSRAAPLDLSVDLGRDVGSTRSRLSAAHPVAPAIRATTHVDGKAIGSSRRPRRRATRWLR
jgi:hypothetical protein